MKSIGILGGAGYQATIPIYRAINQQVLARTKDAHSANIKMLSVDYQFPR